MYISKYTTMKNTNLLACFKAEISNHFYIKIPSTDTPLFPNLLPFKIFKMILVYFLCCNGFFFLPKCILSITQKLLL